MSRISDNTLGPNSRTTLAFKLALGIMICVLICLVSYTFKLSLPSGDKKPEQLPQHTSSSDDSETAAESAKSLRFKDGGAKERSHETDNRQCEFHDDIPNTFISNQNENTSIVECGTKNIEAPDSVDAIHEHTSSSDDSETAAESAKSLRFKDGGAKERSHETDNRQCEFHDDIPNTFISNQNENTSIVECGTKNIEAPDSVDAIHEESLLDIFKEQTLSQVDDLSKLMMVQAYIGFLKYYKINFSDFCEKYLNLPGVTEKTVRDDAYWKIVEKMMQMDSFEVYVNNKRLHFKYNFANYIEPTTLKGIRIVDVPGDGNCGYYALYKSMWMNLSNRKMKDIQEKLLESAKQENTPRVKAVFDKHYTNSDSILEMFRENNQMEWLESERNRSLFVRSIKRLVVQEVERILSFESGNREAEDFFVCGLLDIKKLDSSKPIEQYYDDYITNNQLFATNIVFGIIAKALSLKIVFLTHHVSYERKIDNIQSESGYFTSIILIDTVASLNFSSLFPNLTGFEDYCRDGSDCVYIYSTNNIHFMAIKAHKN